MYFFLITLLLTFSVSLIMVPLVINFANKIGAVDIPNGRKVHKQAVPRIGGVAIYIAYVTGFVLISLFEDLNFSILLAASIIFITGFIDDICQIKPWQKLIGQCFAAVMVLIDGLYINFLTIPFMEQSIPVSAWIAIPISFIWIIGITNAVNLIDGLDGLASGVSIIASTSIFIMALLTGNIEVALLSMALIGSTFGFLLFNFHPAKIFMGDTGSLLLGFLLSVHSLISFKQVTFITFIIPVLILAVPIVDTTVAIVRRKVNKKRIMEPDKNHLHHRLLDSGFSHRRAVIFIYFISIFFGTAAIFLYKANLLTSIFIFILVLLLIEMLIEVFGLVSKDYKPLINLYNRINLNKANVRKDKNTQF
ncbi:glycosyltransferase family 4 protein [Bacillus alveayuensis]|uniref:glycosyltransferase family 4 protein n=1 Tax=Aeribacillus alveayuensis TaxID=279215 RepID=UPI0006983B3B|nr:MraY family glycosyltransferase [Bacillus alveayuensis]